MSRGPVAWVFNIDAEDELALGSTHTPTKQIRARAELLLPVLRGLMGPGDEVLWPATSRPLQAKQGRAWCPTPWAVDQMRRARLQVPAMPSTEVLRQVNHRRFAHRLGQALPGAQFVDDERGLLEALTDIQTLERVSVERNWLLKRPLGYAGRGRRKIATAKFNAADRLWVDAALRSGDGLQVEPFVARELDCALHGLIGPDDMVVLGQPTMSLIDDAGTWLSSVPAPPGALTAHERSALETAARETAQALIQAGYFGPFGLDAFRWRDASGGLHFQPRCELNARYSMGWAVGMTGVCVP